MGVSRGEAEPATVEADADAANQWKKIEMAQMKEKYAKLGDTIGLWEAKKSKQAKQKLTRAERAVERRKLKARQKFKDRYECIIQIAEGARAQAKEKQRSEELKVKERARIMRATGQVPSSCF